jgi:tetratricopeptide (TPR) repeat protein
LNDKVADVLDRMEQLMPRSVIPIDYRIEYEIAMLYFRAGRIDKFNEYSAEVEQIAKAEMNKNTADIQSYYNPYKILLDIYEARGDYNAAIEVLQRIDRISPGSNEVKAKIELFKSKLQQK